MILNGYKWVTILNTKWWKNPPVGYKWTTGFITNTIMIINMDNLFKM